MDYNLGRYRINPRGSYNNTTRYDYLDLVFYNGLSYLCINEEGCRGILPISSENSSIYWQCFATKRDSDGIFEYDSLNRNILIETQDEDIILTLL